jgi:hypothetical protein
VQGGSDRQSTGTETPRTNESQRRIGSDESAATNRQRRIAPTNRTNESQRRIAPTNRSNESQQRIAATNRSDESQRRIGSQSVQLRLTAEVLSCQGIAQAFVGRTFVVDRSLIS